MPAGVGDRRGTLRITCIAPYVPYPNIPHAGGQFLHAHLTALGRSSDVTLLAPGTPENLAVAPGMPAPISLYCTDLGSPLRQRVHRLLTYPADVRAGLTPGAGMLNAARRDAQFWGAVESSDVVEVQWSQWLPLVDDIRRRAPHAAVVAVEHDVLTDSLRRRATAARSWRIRATSRMRLRRAPAAERNLLNRCDAVLVFGARDKEFLRELGVDSPVTVIPPHIDWPAVASGPAEDRVVLFVGAMWRPENAEAMIAFIENCWPAVRTASPDARLRIVGDQPPRHLRDLSDPSVEVTGYVAHLDEEYRRARVVIAPGRTSAGLNFKVVQAMAYALPVVATPESADGIADVIGDDSLLAVTANDDEMARAIVAALEDRSLAATVGARGEQLLRNAWGNHRREDVLDLYAGLVHGRRGDG